MAKENKKAVAIDRCDVFIDGQIIGEITNLETTFQRDIERPPVLSSKQTITRERMPDYNWTAETIELYDNSMSILSLKDETFLIEAMITNPKNGAVRTIVIPNCQISNIGIKLNESSSKSLSGTCGEFYEKE